VEEAAEDSAISGIWSNASFGRIGRTNGGGNAVIGDFGDVEEALG